MHPLESLFSKNVHVKQRGYLYGIMTALPSLLIKMKYKKETAYMIFVRLPNRGFVSEKPIKGFRLTTVSF